MTRPTSQLRQLALAAAATAVLATGCSPTGRRRPESPPPVEVGYGTQEKRDVTGSVSSVSGDEASRGNPTTVAQMIEGRFPGVEVRRLADGGVSIRIRGQRSLLSGNEPLYVVDDVPTRADAGVLQDLDPRDIHSIDVLKDAAATSVYGSRGANGVVLIRTKRHR